MSSERAAALMLWSGGKDAALALQAERREGTVAIRGLLTTVAAPRDTVTMHEVPLALIEAQAVAMGLPLAVMRIPEGAPNAVYEACLQEALAPWEKHGLRTVVVGDLWLEDIRSYREALFKRLGWRIRFPLWRQDTGQLARQFLADGFQAVVASVDQAKLDASFAGCAYDETFLNDLPAAVDPCGECGAFHTFVYGGPLFEQTIPVQVGTTHCGPRLCHAELTRASRPSA